MSAPLYRARFSTEAYIRGCLWFPRMRVTNGIPLGCSPLLPVDAVNCIQTLKVLNLGYPSIAWSSFYNKFIAVGSSVWDCSLIVFALSDDMVTWSEPYVAIFRLPPPPTATHTPIHTRTHNTHTHTHTHTHAHARTHTHTLPSLLNDGTLIPAQARNINQCYNIRALLVWVGRPFSYRSHHKAYIRLQR
jgi:hypothetical protein